MSHTCPTPSWQLLGVYACPACGQRWARDGADWKWHRAGGGTHRLITFISSAHIAATIRSLEPLRLWWRAY